MLQRAVLDTSTAAENKTLETLLMRQKGFAHIS